MVAVADHVGVTDADDGDGRQQGAAVLGHPDALPARADRPGRAEIAVEVLGAIGLERRVDGLQRDFAPAERGHL
jgi:hypothetical protein